MGIKLVAMDLDDTLLDEKLGISAVNKAAIGKAVEQGIKIIPASGRMYCSMEKYARELDLRDPIVAYNGAIIKEPGQEEALFHKPVPLETAKELVEELTALDLHINLYLQDKLYVAKINEKALYYASQSGIPVYEAGDLSAMLTMPPTKILVFTEPEKVDQLMPVMREKYGHGMYITKSKPYYLEFLAPNINKGTALNFLMNYYGIPKEETMAIGDALNDMEMLEAAGVGVAMGNAAAAVKKKADRVVASNVEHGVAEALMSIINEL